ncbi:MAG: carbohydrate ABC transporter permease [Armatimonadota bacterium]|jgi:raffinose/stachyose/melibiose transport system permease protein
MRRRLGAWVRDGLFALLALVFMLPLIWTVLGSFRGASSLRVEPWGMPEGLDWSNYVAAWEGRIGLYLLNSTIVTVVSVAVIIALSAPAAYAFARLRFSGAQLALGFILTGLLIPAHAVLIPLYQMNSALGVGDYVAVIGPYVAFGLPLSVLLLRAYFVEIPPELMEAAIVDGAGHLRILWSIFMPIARPAVATVAIFQAAWVWNELPFALVFIQQVGHYTLPVGLLSFQGEHIANWGAILAGVTIAVVPLMVLYLVFQKHIVRGLTAGAVK